MQITQMLSGVTAADVTSEPIQLGDLIFFSIHVVVTGSDVVGTFTLEASNNGTSWVTVASSSQAITLSDDVFYDVREATYRYVRLVFDYTSGTGTITATAIIKEQSRIA
jgi:hypothetical protein